MVGEFACKWATNLVVVDIPEGLESIDTQAFAGCRSLTAVSFPRTSCEELKSMTIPDSLHTLGDYVRCYNLVPSSNPSGWDNTASEIIAHLRSQQQQL
ncbi:hypothetical protein TrLO_g2703 [Triparma laevis f. longispina]|uniref:Leucine-rich repeat domain-containing protein n=1 Tax=Triparma laevis f. longispina TaxID=1714387 RepID=A0A9W6Z9U7_9STRA|nr:hypothetical protein TrLO_g2703 [Triparma laevis f. longispina]